MEQIWLRQVQVLPLERPNRDVTNEERSRILHPYFRLLQAAVLPTAAATATPVPAISAVPTVRLPACRADQLRSVKSVVS